VSSLRVLTADAPCCPPGILIISKDFVRKKYPMQELHILLRRWQDGGAPLVPVLYGVTVEQLGDIQRQYGEGAWGAAGEKPASAVLARWAEDLQLLQRCTMIRPDQVLQLFLYFLSFNELLVLCDCQQGVVWSGNFAAPVHHDPPRPGAV
jgi:hypothetical protein